MADHNDEKAHNKEEDEDEAEETTTSIAAAIPAVHEEAPKEYPRPGAVSVAAVAPKGKGRTFLSQVRQPGDNATELDSTEVLTRPPTKDDSDLFANLNNSANLQPLEPDALLPPNEISSPAVESVAAPTPTPNLTSSVNMKGRQSRRADAKTSLREETNALRSQGVSQRPGAVSVTGSVTAGNASVSSPGKGDSKTALRAENDALRNQGSSTPTAVAGVSASSEAAVKQEMKALRANEEIIRPGANFIPSSAETSTVKGGSTRAERPRRTTRGTSVGTTIDNVQAPPVTKAPSPSLPGAVAETSKPSGKNAEILKSAGAPLVADAGKKVAMGNGKPGAMASSGTDQSKVLKTVGASGTDQSKVLKTVGASGTEQSKVLKTVGASGTEQSKVLKTVGASGTEQSKVLKTDGGAPTPVPTFLQLDSVKSGSAISKMEMALPQGKDGIDVSANEQESHMSMHASWNSVGQDVTPDSMANEDGLVAAQVINEEELEAQYQAKLLKDVLSAEVVSDDEFREKGRCWKITCCCLLIIAIVLAITIPLSKKEEFSTDAPTPSPTEQAEYDYLVDLLSPFSGDKLLNSSTAQYRAMTWLYYDDPYEDPFGLTWKELNQSTLLERYIGALLYFSLDGANWKDDLHFLSNKSVCEWNDVELDQGIFCHDDDDSVVAIIEFSNQGLNGTLPSELRALSRLEEITLIYDNLYGTLPPELGDMTSLSFLQLVDHQLTGTIPKSYSKLNLRLLNFNINMLTGTVPEGFFANDFQMNALVLEDNLLEGPLPEINRQIPMEYLIMGKNLFEGTIPLSYLAQEKMIFCSVDKNQLTGTIPEQIQALESLSYFYANGNFLTGTLPVSVSTLPALEEFDVGDNNLGGTIPSQFGRVGSLTRLDFSKNSFTGSLPEEISNLTNLAFLDVSSTGLTGTVPSSFANLTLLSAFGLSDTNIVDGLEATFCGLEILPTAITADCARENSTSILCSCCSSCCNEMNECVVNLEGACETRSSEFELVEDRGTVCDCVDDGARMSCVDTACETCNVNRTICARSTDYGHILNETTGEIFAFQNVLQYTQGRNDTIAFYKEVDELTCEVKVNGEKCQHCGISVCTSTQKGILVECSNLPNGPNVNTCRNKIDVGYLEVFWMFDPSLRSGCPPMIIDLLTGKEIDQ